MKCISCYKEFHSPEGDIVPICSFCMVRDTPTGQGGHEEIPADTSSGKNSSGEDTDGFGSLQNLFPDFEIVAEIGKGGMGTVYKARQLALDRLVAIKILNDSHQGDGEFKERFKREAKAMAMLNHPFIIGVHDFGEREGWLYLAMEYVDGRDLDERLRNREVGRVHALSIVEQICEALHYAHGKGVIHRDIKPGNILIDEEGTAKVGDFGLARFALDSHDLSLTMSNVGMGTMGYVAPEQADNAGKIDARADIYALGVLIYVMFNGHLPTGNFPAPTSKFPRPSKSLDEVVLRALAAEPADRCDDVREILQILRKEKPSQIGGRAANADPEQPDPVGPGTRESFNRKHVLWVSALLLIFAFVGAAWFASSKRDQDDGVLSQSPPPPSLEKLLPESGRRGTAAFEKMRRRGGVLRRWSEKPGMVDVEAATGIDDLVYVAAAPNVAMSWYAARSNGEMISSQPGLGSRSDYRRVSHSFFIEWPDRLAPSSPPSGKEFLPLLQPTPRVSDLTQSYDMALILTPAGRIEFGARDFWVKSNDYVLDRLVVLENAVDVESWGDQFVVLTAEGKAHCWIEPHGFFEPPKNEQNLVQVSAGARHLIGLYEDGTIATWCHPNSLKHPRIPSVMTVPPDLGPIIRVESFDFTNAAQRPDGTWVAWGDDEDRGLIDQVNSIGPALDLEFFFVNVSSGAKMVWIDPAPLSDVESPQDSRTPSD